jgi:RNA polymerase sigma factor (sigma-70 family)
MRDAEFEQLYSDHAEALFGFLAYRTADRALAEDLLGEAFLRAVRARRRYDPAKASAKTWLYAIALNCLRDQQRKAGAESRAIERSAVAVAGEGESPDPEIEGVESRDEVERAMTVLSDEEREVVALRYGGDLTGPEMAKLLDEKLTTVEGRLYRALRKLRGELP